MHTRVLLIATFFSIPSLALAGNFDPAPQTPAIWDGDETEPCAWPSVVMVTGNGSLCSGTLIHPKVVLYAAHCGSSGKVVRFGDSQNSGKTEQVEYCKTNPSYNGSSQGNDWAYCVLQNEVTEVPFTPVGYGCELGEHVYSGADIAIVGFGNNDGEEGAGRKRWAFSKMFNPGNNTFNVGGNGYLSVCSGDSGGPAFIRYDDGSWHTYGIASTKNASTCNSAGGTHSRANNAATWIENDSGIDVTVCHDINGNWDPSYLCGGFFDGEPALSYGSWYTWCEDVTSSGWSNTCGVDYGTNEEAVPPQIEIVSPADGASFVGEPTIVDIEIAVADQSGFWDVQIEIEGMLQSKVISNESPTIFDGVEFYAGEYTFVAHGTDFWGNVASSAPVTITVLEEGGSTDSGGETEGGSEESGGEDEGTDSSGGESEGESGGDGSLDDGADEVGTLGDPGAGGESGGCSATGTSRTPWLLLVPLLALARRRRAEPRPA